MQTTVASLASLLAFLCFASCKQNEEQPKIAADLGGWYRAVLRKQGVGEIPFFLSLPADPTKGGAVISNGKQWFSAIHKWDGERVEVDFPMYRTKILATVGSERELFGTWESSSRAWGTASIPFRAVRVDAPDQELKMRTATSPPPEVEASGVWRLSFDKTGPGKIVVVKEGPTAIGATLWFTGAETVYLSGNVVGKRAFLSGFDGTSPYHLAMEIEGDHMRGEWVTAADLSFQESFTGVRGVDFEIKEPISVTAPDRRLRLPELDHPRYAGHPVIVEIAGSWCSHCKNAAPVLTKLYEQYQSQDLRILTLNYEFTEDKSYNLQRAAFFKNEYGIHWQLVTRDGNIEDFWRIMPPGLSGPNEGVSAFPITMFLKRDGTVHALHSGFIGPESGEAHDKLVKKFETWTFEIVR